MGRGFSKRRREMGEKEWADYQRRRKSEKALRYERKCPAAQRHRDAKLTVIKAKGGKCERCDYAKLEFLGAFDFHHRDPSEKEFRLSQVRSLKRLISEVEKCDLLCRRCHAEIHQCEEKGHPVVEWRRRTKLKLIRYKGGRCQECGYDDLRFPRAFDFHHRSGKDFAISGRTIAFNKLRAEVDKCDLLCCRCHAELHARIVAPGIEPGTSAL